MSTSVKISRQISRTIRVITAAVFLFSSVAVDLSLSKDLPDATISPQSIFRPLDNSEIKDLAMLEYLFLSRVMTDGLDVMNKADDVDASIPDMGEKAEKANALFRFSAAVSDESRGLCVIPCSYNGREYWCLCSATKPEAGITSKQFDVKFYTRDEVGDKDPLELLSKVKMAERKERKTIAEAVRYEKNDELIRKAILEGRSVPLTEDNFGLPLYVIYGFLNTVSPDLCWDFKRLVDEGQLMAILNDQNADGDLTEPHAGGRGIYIPADILFMRIGAIVHEVFAKAGFTHEECETFQKIFDRYFSYAFDAKIDPPGEIPSGMKLSGEERRAFAEAGYARIHTELPEDKGELVRSAASAKFLDFYGDPSVPADVAARRDYSAGEVPEEEKYRMLFEKAPLAIAITSLSGKLITANSAMSEMTGYSLEELNSLDMRTTYVVPAERDRMIAMLRDNGEVRDLELKMRRKDGSVITMLMNADWIEIGGERRLMTTGRDITEKKETENALRKSEEKYRMLFDEVPIAIAITSVSGDLVAANKSMCSLMGYSSEEFNSFNMRDSYEDPADRNRMVQALRKFGKVRNMELKIRRKDGNVLVILMNADWIDLGGERMLLTTARDITARKEAEEALKAAHDLLENVINTSQDMIFVKDKDLRVVLCNRYYAQAAGMTPEEMIGKTDIENGWSAELVLGNPIEGIRGFAADDLAALRGETVRNASEQGEMKGKRVVYDVLKLPLKDRAGKIIGVLGVARDVTAERMVQADLEHHADRLRALLELAAMRDRPIKEIMTRALGSMVSLTESGAGFFHTYDEDSGEITLNVWSGNVMPDCSVDAEQHYPLEQAGIWADCVRSRGPVIVNDYRSETNRRGYPPGHFPVDNFISVPVFDKGKIVMICGVGNKNGDYTEADVADISVFMSSAWSMIKIAQAEQELQVKAREWSDTFDAMGEGVSILSPDLEILNVNAALCELLGKKREDVIGKKCREVFHNGGAQPDSCPVEELLRTGKKTRAEVFEPSLKKWLSISVSPILDEHGKIAKIIHVVTDVTERREMEAKMREEEKRAAMGRLIAQIAHELNNPTGVVVGIFGRILAAAALAGDNEAMREISDLAQTGQDEVGRIARLVRELLVQARNEEREKTPQFLGEIAADAVTHTQAMAGRFGVRVDLEYDNEVKIKADRDRMLEVFINLINNACQAMGACPEKNLSIAVSADPDAGAAVVTMTDTGKGMDEETLARVFEGFFTTKAVGEGLGVGMQIVKRIITEHDGKIEISSAPGKGTTFRITFPLTEEKPGAKGYRSDALDEALLAGEARRNIANVLVVDDEGGMRDNWKAFLKGLGVNAVVAENMDQALELAAASRFDAVITDVTMKNAQFREDSYQGYKLAVKLRAAGYDGPIAVCTGYDKDAPELVRLAKRNIVTFGVSKALIFALGLANVEKCVKALERVEVVPPDGQLLKEYEAAIVSGDDGVFAAAQGQNEEVDEDAHALSEIWTKLRKSVHDINNLASVFGYLDFIFTDVSGNSAKSAATACGSKIMTKRIPEINIFEKKEPPAQSAPGMLEAMIKVAEDLRMDTDTIIGLLDVLKDDEDLLSQPEDTEALLKGAGRIRGFCDDIVVNANAYIKLLAEVEARREPRGDEAAEALIKQSEENFMRTLDASPMGIMLFSGDKRLFYANTSAAGVLGVRDIDGLRGRDLQDVVGMSSSDAAALDAGRNVSFVARVNGAVARCNVAALGRGEAGHAGYIMQICYEGEETELRQKLAGLEEGIKEFSGKNAAAMPATMRSLEIQARSAGLTALVYGKENMQADAAEQKLRAAGFKGNFVRVIGELSDLEAFLKSANRPPFDFVVNATAERIEDFIKKILAGSRSVPVIDDISQKNELSETLFKICA